MRDIGVKGSHQLAHETEDLIIIGFIVFVCVMVLVHCQLKRQHTQKLKEARNDHVYHFEWERRDDDD